MLAVRAVERGALPLHDLPDRRAADAAGLAGAIVDQAIELEVAAAAVAADEIPQRAAAARNGFGRSEEHTSELQSH